MDHPGKLLLALWISLSSCFAMAADVAPAKLNVFVTVAPEEYFVSRVGGNFVAVQSLVGAGQSPHTYEPTPKQVAALSEAKIYYRIGIPLEEVILNRMGSTFKNLKVVDLSQGLQTLPDLESEPQDMSHPGSKPAASKAARDVDLDHGEHDPHIWMDPLLVEKMAGTIAQTLGQLDPAHKAEFEKNRQEFVKELEALDKKIQEKLAPMKGKTFFVFHPDLGYFAQRYGLVQQALESGGKEPSSRHLAELIGQAKREGIKVIFTQPQYSPKPAETIAQAIGGKVVSIDPLSRDYMNTMNRIADEIAKSFGGGL